MVSDAPTPPPRRRALDGLDPAALLARALADQPGPEAPPEVPGYTLGPLLGRGGMGAVFEAVQRSLDRPVAVKLLDPADGAEPNLLARLEREARLMAAVAHPHIVAVHDFVPLPGGRAAVVMERVTGGSLRDRLRAHPRGLPAAEALRLLRETASGLAAAHARGVVHRDLKPENILLDDQGRARLTDFGIALPPAAARTRLTVAGASVGTLDYMAPEQARGEAVDARADVFSLGVVGYELLTGQVPRGSFEPPDRIRPGVPAAVAGVLLRALRPDPARRFADASALLAALRAAEAGPSRRIWLAGAAALAAGGLALRPRRPGPVPAGQPGAGEWRDLLAGADPAGQAFRGGWTRSGSALLTDAGICILRLLVSVPAAYEVRVRFTRLEGIDSMALFLRVDGSVGTVDLDGWRRHLGGLQVIGGRTLETGPSFPCRLTNGRPCDLHVEVRPGRVRMRVDGELRGEVALEGRPLSVAAPWAFAPGPDFALGLGSWQSPTRFETAAWRPLAAVS